MKTLIALLALLTITVLAQPTILRLRYQVCPPTPDDMEYAAGHPSVYYEFNDNTNNEVLSGIIAISNLSMITIEWTSQLGKLYAVESTPVFGDYWLPFTRNSDWIVGTGQPMQFVHSTQDQQRFYRIAEK
jgi:hypothetical protein